MIKLIALDLDGTTLKSDGNLSKRTIAALERALEKKVHVVIATGRVLSALPKEMLAVKGIHYALTSNGANVIDLSTRKPIYTNFINNSAVEIIVGILRNHNYMIESFTGGHAYIEKEVYDNIKTNGSVYNNTEYLLNTREPVENLLDHILKNKDSIENININFEDQKDRTAMKNVLMNLSNISITSSFDYNLEICGKTASKAKALLHLCGKLGIKVNQVMACGDSHNDIEMLKVVGLPVAVGNAKNEVKAVAKYISSNNNDNGVAETIERFVLR